MKKLLLVLCLITGMLCFGACSGETDVIDNAADAATTETISTAARAAWEETFLANMDSASIQEEYELFLEEENEAWANAMLAWENTLGDLGAYVEEVSVTVTKNEDKSYTCSMVQKFAERNLEVELTVDKDVSYWQGVALNAEYTFAEKMTKAALNTAIGMAVVFVVLIIIALVISLFKYIPALQAKFSKKKASASVAPEAAPAPAPAPVVAEEEELVDDLELVAVIMAAIAASENTSADGLVVRSIKRAKTAGWRRA